MEVIYNFFKELGKTNIDEESKNLLSTGLIDSFDIMGLVSLIEDHYGKPLDVNLIEPQNFESFESIRNMIMKAYDLSE